MTNAKVVALGLILFGFSSVANAQMSRLPRDAEGNPAMPPVVVTVGVFGAYWGAKTHNNSLSKYLYGEAGKKIEKALDTLSIDVKQDKGAFSFDIQFIVRGIPLHVPGLIDKKIGESLEKAFERHFELGTIDEITRRYSTRLSNEIFLFEVQGNPSHWFAYSGSTVSGDVFGGLQSGRIRVGVVTISDCDSSGCKELD